jgi:putative Mg2+ transporter-C (MgtC) family protein
LATHEFPFEESPKAYDLILKREEPFLGVLLKYDVEKDVDFSPISVAEIKNARNEQLRLDADLGADGENGKSKELRQNCGSGVSERFLTRTVPESALGIGFIGAGTILIQKQFVRGLTTAAGLWATAGIALAVGGGMYWIGVAAMLLTLVGLEFLTVIVKNVGEHSSLLIYSTTIHDNLKKIVDELQAKEYKVSDYEVQREILEHGEIYHVSMVIRTKRHLDESELFQFLQNLPDLTIERLI